MTLERGQKKSRHSKYRTHTNWSTNFQMARNSHKRKNLMKYQITGDHRTISTALNERLTQTILLSNMLIVSILNTNQQIKIHEMILLFKKNSKSTTNPYRRYLFPPYTHGFYEKKSHINWYRVHNVYRSNSNMYWNDRAEVKNIQVVRAHASVHHTSTSVENSVLLSFVFMYAQYAVCCWRWYWCWPDVVLIYLTLLLLFLYICVCLFLCRFIAYAMRLAEFGLVWFCSANASHVCYGVFCWRWNYCWNSMRRDP